MGGILLGYKHMALIQHRYCDRCESHQSIVNGYCAGCKQRKYIQDTAAWSALTQDEKLQDLRRRIEKLEQGPPTY